MVDFARRFRGEMDNLVKCRESYEMKSRCMLPRLHYMRMAQRHVQEVIS